jgi:hypothetical protein
VASGLCARVTILAILALLTRRRAEAQSRFHAGAALTLATERPSGPTDPAYHGGLTTWSGSALLGVRIHPRVFLELEPGLVGRSTGAFTYAAFRDQNADVTWERREAFVTGQVRWKLRALEPIAGARYVRTATSYHSRFPPSGGTYSDSRYSDHAVAFVAGVDAAIPVGPRFALVPTFRAIVRPSPKTQRLDDPGTLRLCYGAGVRIAF